MLGNLLFEIKCNKWKAIIYAIISLIIGICLGLYCITYWESLVAWLAITLTLICLLCLWYTYDRISAVRNNKLSFYEKGMMIKNGNTETKLLLADIKNYNTATKEGISTDFTITFTTHDDKIISLDSDDYENLSHSLTQYGQKVNFELRTSF